MGVPVSKLLAKVLKARSLVRIVVEVMYQVGYKMCDLNDVIFRKGLQFLH